MILKVQSGLACMAVSTQGHVHICTSNRLLATFVSGSKRKRCWYFAQFADRRDFLYFLAQRNQLYYVLPGSSVECALQRRNDYDFLGIGCSLRKLNQIAEKLPLVNSNHIKLSPSIADFAESSDWNGIFSQT
jgi:hypothetical protein